MAVKNFEDGLRDGWDAGYKDAKNGLRKKHTICPSGHGEAYGHGWDSGYIEGFRSGKRMAEVMKRKQNLT